MFGQVFQQGRLCLKQSFVIVRQHISRKRGCLKPPFGQGLMYRGQALKKSFPSMPI